MEIKEYEIPVPWGYIAVKAWGDEKGTPVLVLHGRGDNAGSFDQLIPLLPGSLYYICMDLPSHGKSSPFPPYLLINAFSVLQSLKLVLDYLNKKQYIFMGHSWGGQLLIYFCQLFPEYVIKIVTFDAIYLEPITVKSFGLLRYQIETLIEICDKLRNKTQSNYTYQEIMEELNNNRIEGGLNAEAAADILKRSLIPLEDGRERFSMDDRIKTIMNIGYDLMYSCNMIKRYPIQCPMLLLISKSFKPLLTSTAPILEALQQGNKNCLTRDVHGNHDVHINAPEKVAPIVAKFLLRDSKL